VGSFLEAEDLKQRTDSPLVKRMELDDLDDRFIVPAERAIEEAFGLELDTDNIPWHRKAEFELRSDLRDRFTEDYRRSVIALVNFWADNPHAYGSQSVGGASVVYGSGWPPQISVLMNRWTIDGERSGRVRRG